MAIQIDKKVAKARLSAAYQEAVKKTDGFTSPWLAPIRLVWEFPTKTWVVALGTVLLAKSVDSTVDVGSIKSLNTPDGQNTFSLRTLGHGVLVPEAVRLGFSIRATCREPLNNQPFFRYSHMDEMDRVRDRESLKQYRAILQQISPLSSDGGIGGLTRQQGPNRAIAVSRGWKGCGSKERDGQEVGFYV